MDDYKEKLCAIVQLYPLLWDPDHPEYKHKERRQEVWTVIEKMLPPCRKGSTAKDIWTSLNRSYCNAVNRRKNKTFSGIVGNQEDRLWKFEKNMAFLVDIKSKRAMGNWEIDNEPDINDSELSGLEESISHQSTDDFVSDGTSNFDHEGNKYTVTLNPSIDTQGTSELPAQTYIKTEPSVKKRKCEGVNSASVDSVSQATLITAMQHRLEENRDSPRLKFFKSLMPRVDSFTEDQFLDFQIDVLNLLKMHSQHTPHPMSRSSTPASWSSANASYSSHPDH